MAPWRAPGYGVLAALAFAGAARAEAGDVPVRVVYGAPTGCPSEDAFFAEVAARTPRARRAAEEAPARTFEVSLMKGSEASFGRVTIRDADGTASERDVTGDTCGEVVSALAL